MLIGLTLPLLTAACAVSPVEQTAICDATRADRRAHAAALIYDGGPQSRATGDVVLTKIEVGCAE